MSPNDTAFLKSLGIKPEEIVPASKPAPGFAAVFEPCPMCSARRHRNLTTGEVFCISCAARKQRELATASAVGSPVTRAHLAVLAMRLQKKIIDSVPLPLPVTYRGFQIEKAEGQGIRYRHPAEHAFAMWRDADNLQDAMRKIDRLVERESGEVDEVRVENRCRGCDGPCGGFDWCRDCARSKFGDAS